MAIASSCAACLIPQVQSITLRKRMPARSFEHELWCDQSASQAIPRWTHMRKNTATKPNRGELNMAVMSTQEPAVDPFEIFQ